MASSLLGMQFCDSPGMGIEAPRAVASGRLLGIVILVTGWLVCAVMSDEGYVKFFFLCICS